MSKKKTMCIIAKGGECEACGFKFDGENGYLFDLHHDIPNGNTSRRFNSSTELNRTRIADLPKFLEGKTLFCAMCHRKHHHGDLK